ncbi:MAG: efflux RND transporter periplasmic adaptor subunit [Verrucomicrobiales bacterium]
MSSKSKNNPLLFIILALVTLGVAWWGIKTLSEAKPAAEGGGNAEAPAGMPPASVVTAPVAKEEARQTHRVVGTLKARQRSEIAVREAGPLMEILVDEGDLVEANALIARIDPRRLSAQKSELQAEVTVASSLLIQRQAEIARATTDLEMKERLFSQKALSKSELLDARRAASVGEAQVKAAEDSLNAAKARLELINVRLADAEIRAPFTGRVVARHSEPGEWLNPGEALVTLVSSGEIEAWLQVPERFAAAANGEKIPVTLSATGQEITSTKLTLVPEADTATRTVRIVALLPDPDHQLVPGLSVTAQLPVSKKSEELVVPVNAISQSYAGPGVFIATEQEGSPMPLAKRVPVEVLYQSEGRAYLRSEGIKPGDPVVVQGNERLMPMQPLMIAPPAPAEGAPVSETAQN